MFDKWNFYKRLKDNVNEKEHLYNASLEELEIALSKINKGIIHGKKEQGVINSINSIISKLTRASYEYELACYRLHSYLKNGEIKYE